jgi:toxin ParE1/3/4
MMRIELAPEVMDDLQRITQHLQQHEISDTTARIGEIIAAIDVLVKNPLIGRPAENRFRELIIGHDSRGYIALYRYLEEIDLLIVLAIRSQREAGYLRG